ncbi:hypothetical protein CLD22_02860 [Rubrivivax gelatinosus]|nr:hypothetical protein [Rubrivivax gelatinosus]
MRGDARARELTREELAASLVELRRRSPRIPVDLDAAMSTAVWCTLIRGHATARVREAAGNRRPQAPRSGQMKLRPVPDFDCRRAAAGDLRDL